MRMKVKKDSLDENLDLSLNETFARLNEEPAEDREWQNYVYDWGYGLINEIDKHYENSLNENINKDASTQLTKRFNRNKRGI